MADDYILGRAVRDSIRLDAQHLLWMMHLDYVLHPSIPITNGMKIAELGTGTGVWIFDAARKLPAHIQLDGYDVSNNQFPPASLWPNNVKLGLMDSFADPPVNLQNQYDVVHLRMWASNLQNGDTLPLLTHITKLLKPGGYLQWEEADLIHQAIKGDMAQELEIKMNELFRNAKLDYAWVPDLPNRMAPLELVSAHNASFQHDLVHMCTNTYLLALLEIVQGINRRSGLAIEEQQDLLRAVLDGQRDEIVYNWSPLTVLARKSR